MIHGHDLDHFLAVFLQKHSSHSPTPHPIFFKSMFKTQASETLDFYSKMMGQSPKSTGSYI